MALRPYKPITQQLLEHDPKDYLSRLKTIISTIEEYPEDMVSVRNMLQDTSVYDTWHSNHVMCLSYLVGKPKEIPGPYKIWHDYGSYYGKGKEISEELGIEIFECMAFFKPDMTIKNFFGDNIIESMENTETCVYRKDNGNFLKRVKELLNKLHHT